MIFGRRARRVTYDTKTMTEIQTATADARNSVSSKVTKTDNYIIKQINTKCNYKYIFSRKSSKIKAKGEKR